MRTRTPPFDPAAVLCEARVPVKWRRVKEDGVPVQPLSALSQRVLLLLVSLSAAFALHVATAGAASPSKPYEVTLAPADVPAGVTVAAFTVQLTNRTGTQQLGSAEVTVPSAFAVVGAPGLNGPGSVTASGNVLSLRALALPPDASVTVTVGVRMPCVAGTYSWAVEAKQSNDFKGPPGNTLGPILGSLATAVSGSCSLRFATQPAGTEKNELIRAQAFQPSSTQLVSVEAVDGSASPQRLTWFTGPVTMRLAPTSYLGRLDPAAGSVAAVAGVASFPVLRIDASGVYNLRATTTAAGFTAVDSRSFQVVDIADDCNPAKCSAQLAGSQTTSTVTGAPGSDSGLLLLSLNLGPDPSCAGYTPPSADWFEFQLTAARDKTIVAAYSKAAMRTVAGPSSLEICFAAPDPFPAKSGPAAPFDYDGEPGNGAEGFVGLLPNCPAVTPCVLKRSGATGGGATVSFFVSAAWGDPRFH
jgi:hypothetical protein